MTRDSESELAEAPTPELLARFRSAEGSAYGTLFRRYKVPLSAFIQNHTDSALRVEVSVDDLVQEVHVAALTSLDKFEYRRPLSFFFWLCGIARRRIAMQYRRRGRRAPLLGSRVLTDASSHDLLSALACQKPSPLEQVVLQENITAMAAALQQLSPRRERAIILRFIEGVDNATAAVRMEMTSGAFRVLLSRALFDLRDALNQAIGEG